MARAEATEWRQWTRLWFFCLIEVFAAHSLNSCLSFGMLPACLSQQYCFWYLSNCLMTLSMAKMLSLRHKLLQVLTGIVTKVWGLVLFGIFSLVLYFLYILKQTINSCVSAALTNSTEISWSQLSDLTNRRQFLFLRKANLLSSCICHVRLLEGM